MTTEDNGENSPDNHDELHCPKCEGLFEPVTIDALTVQRCVFCRGLWLEMLQKEDLQAIEGSETIDRGMRDEEIAAREDIACPKCHVPMLTLRDKDQFHIIYEACPTCYGTFLDAGELRDLKEFTFAERLQQTVATLKANLR